MKKAVNVVVLLSLALVTFNAFWQGGDAVQGVERARTGDYSAAVRMLEPLVEKGENDPIVVESLYRSWIRQGEYDQARQQFEAWAKARPNAAPIRLAAGRILRLTGNYAAALPHLDAALTAANVGMAARFEKAGLLEETGKRAEATSIYQAIVDSFLNSPNTPPRNLLYVAASLEALEQFQEANNVYRTAVKADPQNAEAQAAWGDLFARKYAETDAITSYREALKVDPNMPEALLGLAKNLAATAPEEAEEQFDMALAVNPKLPEAHLYAASKLIESELYEQAQESINKALAVNPQMAEGFSMMATVYYLLGDTAEFNRYRDRVFQTNPQYSRLYYTLADHAVTVRLYKDAVKFAREALKLNPRDWDSMTLLGINLLRIGEEQEGTNVLEAAFAGDPLNVWAGNTLNLLDDFAAGEFDRFKTEHFEVKLHKSESEALKPYVTDLLERAYDTLSAKYNFTPEQPLHFEMFPNHGDFEVRAVGLTGLGALGVCFGHLFVMDSPTARELDHFNWGSTLWHEFAHVITLQMTDYKVPRWLSEGLSVFEERLAYPGWGDDMKLDNLRAIQEKKLLPIAQLNDGFMHPKYAGQVLVSYYQASMVAEYIEGKWGFDAIRNMLGLYKNGADTEEVFRQALKVGLEAFDAEFLKWIEAKAAGIDTAQYGKLLEEGVQALEAQDNDKAIAALKQAVEMYPEYSDENNAWEPLAEAYLMKGDKAAATDVLKRYLAYSELSFTSYVKLSELLEESGDKAGAAKALEGAMYVRPTDLRGHSKLGTLMLELKQFANAAREYETLIALKTPDRATAYYLLAQSYLGAGRRVEARRAVLSSLDIAPSYEPAQNLLVEILK